MNMKNVLGIGAAICAVAGTAATIINHNKKMRERTATEPAAEHAAEPAATVNTANGAAITTIVPGRFLTMYEIAAQTLANGKMLPPWRFVSRRPKADELPAVTHDYKPDAVAIQAIWQDPETLKVHLVLIKQFRATVDDYVIELPAGLVDNGEVALSTALRETFEETGLNFVPNSDAKIQLGFSSIGMTDECIGLAYGQCFGTHSSEHQEATENIEVILADLEMCQTILAATETHPCDIRALFAMRSFVDTYQTP